MTQPELIVICGNAGVGKTTYGLALARKIGACLLDIDTVSERLVQAGLSAALLDPNDRDSPRFKQIFRDPIHETLFDLAVQNLEHQSCIVVAPFTKERRDPSFLDWCRKRTGRLVTVHYLTCAESTRKKRLVARHNPRDINKLASWDEYSMQGRDYGVPPFPHVHVITESLTCT